MMDNTYPIPAAAFQVNQYVTTADEFSEHVFSPDAGFLRLTTNEDSRGGLWSQGDFVDYRGIVSIIRDARFTRFDTVAGNRCYIRTWRKYYGDRTVAQLCRSFLTELHGHPMTETPEQEASNGR